MKGPRGQEGGPPVESPNVSCSGDPRPGGPAWQHWLRGPPLGFEAEDAPSARGLRQVGQGLQAHGGPGPLGKPGSLVPRSMSTSRHSLEAGPSR